MVSLFVYWLTPYLPQDSSAVNGFRVFGVSTRMKSEKRKVKREE